MQKEEINIYKGYLKAYPFYKKMVKIYRDELEELIVQREGVSAISYDKVPVQGSGDPLNKSLYMLELADRIEEVEIKLTYFRRQIKKIDEDLKQMQPNIADVMIKIYCLESSTFEKEARKMYVSKSTLQRMVDEEIEKIERNIILG